MSSSFTTFPYGLVYGPHLSKRLGLSLGVDLTPMICNFNCVYCERGRTITESRDYRDFTSKVKMETFIGSLKQRIKTYTRFDCLTFAGTGEPTLEIRLGEFIASARMIVEYTPIKVITNASLLTHNEVIRNLADADEVIAKLNAVSDNVFAEMHRPFDGSINAKRIIKGLHALKREIGSKVTIEVLFIRSHQPIKTNNTDEEVMELTRALRELEPSKVQVHTIRRFPAEPYILPVSRRFLDKVSMYMKKRLPKTDVSIYT